MKKIIVFFAFFSFVFTANAYAGPQINVINQTKLGTISFGFTSYKIVNGSSTRQGSGGSIQVDTAASYTDFPPMAQGDQLTLDKGLRISNTKGNLSSDGTGTCGASGFSDGLNKVFGRGFMQMNDTITVEVTAKKNDVIPELYDAVCTYSK